MLSLEAVPKRVKSPVPGLVGWDWGYFPKDYGDAGLFVQERED